MTKFYADAAGAYLGGFDGAEPPAGSQEVPEPPHGLAKWDGSKWVRTPAQDRAEAAGELDDLGGRSVAALSALVEVLIAQGVLTRAQVAAGFSGEVDIDRVLVLRQLRDA